MYFIQSISRKGKPFNTKVFENRTEFLRDLISRKYWFPTNGYKYGKTIEQKTV